MVKKMNDYMQLAIAAAKDGITKGDGGPFGCVITQAGQVIAVAHNEVVKNNDCTCHGEIQAIRKACKKLKTFDLSGCNLYTTAAPCPMCKGPVGFALTYSRRTFSPLPKLFAPKSSFLAKIFLTASL